MTEEYAGYLCATQIGQWVTVDGCEGWLYDLRHRADRETVMMVLHQPDGERSDGSLRKRVQCLFVSPRAVVQIRGTAPIRL